MSKTTIEEKIDDKIEKLDVDDKSCIMCRNCMSPEVSNLYLRKMLPYVRRIMYLKKGTNHLLYMDRVGIQDSKSTVLKCDTINSSTIYCAFKDTVITDIKEMAKGDCEFFSPGPWEYVEVEQYNSLAPWDDVKDDENNEGLPEALTGQYKCDSCGFVFKLHPIEIKPWKTYRFQSDSPIFCNICGNICNRIK